MPGGLPLARAAEEIRLETVFSDNRGRSGYGKLAQGNDGWLYGTTRSFGQSGGTVFSMTTDGV